MSASPTGSCSTSIPSTQKFAEVRAAARATGELLSELGLAPHAMVTGSRGIHVTVPIKRVPFEEAFAFAKAVAARLADEHPKKLTTEFHKAKRGDRIFVDVLRNRYAQHAVPPYAVRPRPKAPVAAPLHWDELDERSLKPDRWTIASMPKRLEETGRLARHRRPRAVDQYARYGDLGLASRRCAGRSARPGPPGGSGWRPR